ncbi:MAG: MFS transporter [Dehalococcoidia bacterium]|jgi:MFS family permease|nr:MFS transporter [Dehalococcoidia bacterium]
MATDLEPRSDVAGAATEDWRVVAAGFLCIVFAFGVPTMVMPVIYSPIIDEFGWSRAQVTFVASLKFGAGAVFGIFFGALADRFSIRKIVVVFSLVSIAAMVGFLWIETLWQFYAAGLVMGAGAIAVMIAVKVLVSQRFLHRQGFAIGAALLGTSVAGSFTPLLATAMIAAYGWRMTVALLSSGIWLVAIPVFLWIVKEPDAADAAATAGAGPRPQPPNNPLAPAEMDFSAVLRSRSFWLVALAVMLIGLADQSMGQHLMLYLERDVGFARSIAATVLSAVFVVSIAGKLGFGWLYDKLSVKGVMWCYGLMAVAIVLAFSVQLLPMLVLFTVARGLAHGGAIVDIPVLSKHCFGPRVLGRTIGVLTACVAVGFAIGPPLVGYMYDTQGSYRNAFLLLIGVSVAAALTLLGVRATYRERVAELGKAGLNEVGGTPAWVGAKPDLSGPSN